MLIFRHQNAGQDRNLMTSNKSFENVAKGKCLGTTVTDQNSNHEIRLISGNACYHSLQSLLSSSFVSSNSEIKIYKTVLLSFVLYGCAPSSLSLTEEHRFRVSENRVLRRVFGPKRRKVAVGWKRLNNEELHNL